jgi:plasmid stabilization system protein ParE
MTIKFFDEATQELVNIYNLIALQSKKSAINIYNNILDEIDRLKIFPNIGKVHSSILRILIVLKKYYVVYYFDKRQDIIYIVLIWDCRRDPEVFRRKVLKSLE